jgi:hypothetical protein
VAAIRRALPTTCSIRVRFQYGSVIWTNRVFQIYPSAPEAVIINSFITLPYKFPSLFSPSYFPSTCSLFFAVKFPRIVVYCVYLSHLRLRSGVQRELKPELHVVPRSSSKSHSPSLSLWILNRRSRCGGAFYYLDALDVPELTV